MYLWRNRLPRRVFTLDKRLLKVDEIFKFLDDLRASGTINMFGAPTVLREQYPHMTKAQSKAAFVMWSNTFPKDE